VEDESIENLNKSEANFIPQDKEIIKSPTVQPGKNKAVQRKLSQGIEDSGPVDIFGKRRSLPKIVLALFFIIFLIITLVIALLIRSFLPTQAPAEEVQEEPSAGQEEVAEEEPLTEIKIPVNTNAMRDSLRDIEDSVADIDATFELIDESVKEDDDPPTF